MRKGLLICFLILALSGSLITAGVSVAESQRFQKDLTGDGKPETIVAQEIFDESDPPGIGYRQAIETRISVLKPDGSVLAEGSARNGKPKIEFINLRKDRRRQIVVWTLGGMHYTDIAVFEYGDGKLKEIFADGSACPVNANFKGKRPTISVGREDMKDPSWSYADGPYLWNVYVWNGSEFKFDPAKSTAGEISQEEAASAYVDRVTKDAGER